MSGPSSGGGSVAALAASRAVFVASGLVANLAMARALDREVFGLARWILALTALLAFGANLGLGAFVTRTLARTPEVAPRLVPATLRATAMLSVVTGCVVCAYVGWRDPRSDVVLAAALGAVALAGLAGGQMVEAALHGLHQTRREVAPAMVGRGLLVVGTLAVLAAGGGLVPVFAVRAGAQLVTTLWLLVALARVTGGLLWADAHPPVVELVRTGRTFGASVLFGAVAAQADVLLIEAFIGEEEVARYGAPASVLLQLGLGATILSRSFFPRLARLTGDPAAFGEVLAVQTRFMLTASLPVAVGGLAVGAAAVPWLFGAAYADAVAPFLVLVLVVPLRFLHNGLGLALTALDGQRERARLDAAVAAVNVGLNLVAVPRWGAEGAAVTTLLTDLLLVGLVARAVRARVPSLGIAAGLRGALPAAVGMGALVAVTPGPVIVRVGLGVVVYAGLARLTGAWQAGDGGRLRSL